MDDPALEPYKIFMQKKVGPVVHEIARGCGHTFDQITFEVSSSPHPEFAVNTVSSKIMASKGAMDALQGGNFSTVSRELKAVLAHEIAGHVGHHKNLHRLAKTSIFASPLIAIAAYELIRRNLPGSGSKEDAAEKIVDADKSQSGHANMSDHLYAIAKYVAVGALGLAVGSFVARHLSRRAEFFADRRAIEFTKDPEAMVSALAKLEHTAEAAIRNTSQEARNVTEWLSDVLLKFKNATYWAHPNLAERTSYIRSL